MVILQAANVRKVESLYSLLLEKREIGVVWKGVVKSQVKRIGKRIRRYFAKLLHGPIIILPGLKHVDRPSASACFKVENEADLREKRTLKERSCSMESRFFSV